MTYRPGQRLVAGAGLLAVLAVGVFFHYLIVVIPLIGLIVLTVAAEIDRRHVTRQLKLLSVSRSMPAIAARDRPFRIVLRITNSGEDIVTADVRDIAPDDCVPAWWVQSCTIAARQQQEVTIDCRIPRRGKHGFGPVWIRATGPRGLVEAQQPFACSGDIRVFPETFASSEQLVKDTGAQVQLMDRITRTRQHGSGTEFESLHAFRLGDDPRRIDWRATARMRQPIVRRFQVERHRDVVILIDSGRLMGSDTGQGSKLDCAVDAALNLARVALQSGDRCGVAAYDSEVRGFLPPAAGIRSLSGIVDSVYGLETRWKESDFTRIHAELQSRQSKRSLLVVLSDLSDAETSRLQCAALQQLSRRHLVLFAAIRTPLLNDVIHEPTNTVIDGARKAVTFRLLKDRGRALHVLERTGVHVLDVEPKQITLPLINQFIELRRRNLL